MLTSSFQAIVGTYFSSIVHTIGSGLLGRSIVETIGGSNQIAWLTMALLIPQLVLGPTIVK